MSKVTDRTKLVLKNLAEVRHKIDAKAYVRSNWQGLFWCVLDLMLYGLFMYGVFVSEGIIARLGFGLLAGVAASSMFVLAHDAAHGALFKSSVVAELMGTIYMLPALNIYRLWCFGHNRIHHGFTSFSPVDWIWRPLTVAEYKNLSGFKKVLYRFERSIWGCGLHYLLKVWWPKMVFFMPEKLDRSKRIAIRLSKCLVFAFAVGVAALFYHHTGVFSAFCALIVPFIVFNYVMSLIVYLHHTHPEVPFFDKKAEWSQAIGAVFCTTVIHTPWIIEKWITHSILIHTPHHVDIRIPFYRLKTAFNSLKQNYSEHILEYKMNFATLVRIFKTCKLYDFKKHTWHDFSAAS
jgi:omega-6 fatty acid desaturase (delta-12 desaturase)